MTTGQVDSIVTINGELRIDTLNGLIMFIDSHDRTILRVSHLREPIPDNVIIDIVSLPNLTSYTPLQEPDRHKESFQEWRDEGIEPVPPGKAEQE